MKKTMLALVVLSGIVMVTMGTSGIWSQPSKTTAEDLSDQAVIVFELFTSQGCSSCPPADALLAKVHRESTAGIIALSYHVDYWNYIGWDDPFS
ncbi:MAG: DUF1223 domain-containing protein, partial [Flavobacteriaceae bacterium]